jgi:hypothetical protein
MIDLYLVLWSSQVGEVALLLSGPMLDHVDLVVRLVLLPFVLLRSLLGLPLVLCLRGHVLHHIFAYGAFVSHLGKSSRNCQSLADQLLGKLSVLEALVEDVNHISLGYGRCQPWCLTTNCCSSGGSHLVFV